MHIEALTYVNRFANADSIRVVEFGSLDINGTPRWLFPNAAWWGIDVVDGPGVDEVADAATWSGEPADMVVCCEVLEHAPDWENIVTNMVACCRVGGRVLVTAAGPNRAPHSAVDGGELRDGEHYANVDPDTLRMVLKAAGATAIEVESRDGIDVYATGLRAEKKVAK